MKKLTRYVFVIILMLILGVATASAQNKIKIAVTHGNIVDDPSIFGKRMKDLSSGDSLVVISAVNKKYFKVRCGNLTGYIYKAFLPMDRNVSLRKMANNYLMHNNKELYKYVKRYGRKKGKKMYKIAQIKKNNKKLYRLVKEYGLNKGQKMYQLSKTYSLTEVKKAFSGKLWIGMDKKLARIAAGSPSKVNSTTTKYGASESWFYWASNSYDIRLALWFKNGKLTTIQR